jgi:hypothetical protein
MPDKRGAEHHVVAVLVVGSRVAQRNALVFQFLTFPTDDSAA